METRRRRTSLPASGTASTSAPGPTSISNPSQYRPEPIHIRNVPAPLPTPALSTPPASASDARMPLEHDTVDMLSRPMTPGPSPRLDAMYTDMDLDEDEPAHEHGQLPRRVVKTVGNGAEVVMRGKEKASQMVGLDPRRETSLLGSCGPADLLLRFQRFDKNQRAQFLSSLVDDLELNEAVTVSRRIEPRIRRDFLRELPLELALHCMSFIDEARTLGRAAQVSRYWNHLFSDEQTWKEIYDRHRGMSHTGFVPPSNSPFLRYARQFQSSRAMGLADVRRDDADTPLRTGMAGFANALGRRPFAERSGSGSFKQQFKQAYITESNWLHGGRVMANHFPASDGPVTTLSMDEKHVAVGMANSRIHVFDIETGRIKQHLIGHGAGVWALALVSKNPMADPAYRSPPNNDDARSTSSLDGARGYTRRSSASAHRTSAAGTGAGGAGAGTARTQFGILPAMGLIDHVPRPNTASGYANQRPRPQARKMPSSDPCGAALGWPGLRRDLVVSGGSDRTLRVWDIDRGVCVHTLSGHRSTLRCLKMLDGTPICVTGSRDATVKVWNIEAGALVHDLRGHSAAVRCLEVAGNQIVSGSYDATCRLWDAETGECLYVLAGHYGQIYAVAFDGVRIVAGSADSTVRVWSAQTGECLALLQGHTSLVGQLQLTDDILTTGGSDGRIIVFNLATMQCLERLCAHDNSVTCLQFDQRFIVSGGNDGRAKVWDMQTGRFLRELTVACEAVWRVTFKSDRVVILCQRQHGLMALEFVSFRPEDDRTRAVTASPPSS